MSAKYETSNASGLSNKCLYLLYGRVLSLGTWDFFGFIDSDLWVFLILIL